MKHWFGFHLEGEAFFEFDVPEGREPHEVAVELMSDDSSEATIKLVKRMLEEGIVSLGVRTAQPKRAETFNAVVARLKEPFDPDDYVVAERPKRRETSGS